MQPLDTINFPLTGLSLIEASAGTGKTYTIINVYLRMVLGHKCEARSVEEMLVVTFTQAATAELKSRVRAKLTQAYLDFYQDQSDDPLMQVLLEECERDLALKRLDLACKQMDLAAIFTIQATLA